MKALFPSGPWTSWLNGQVIDHPAEIWHNDAGEWMTAVYEERDHTLQGVLLEAFVAFKAEGNVDALLQSLPFAALEFSVRTSDARTIHFVLVRSAQAYSLYVEEGVKLEAGRVLDDARQKGELLAQAAIAHDLRLTRFSELPAEEQALFSTQLALAPFLANSTLVGKRMPIATEKTMVLLGTDLDKKTVSEQLDAFAFTIVEGQNVQNRSRALQIHVENMLLAKKPVVILDFENRFSGLSSPASEPVQAGGEGVLEPVGFPVSRVGLFRDAVVPLHHADAALYAAEFQWNARDQAGKAISRVLESASCADWKQVAQVLSDMPSSEAFKDYPKSRALRIATLLANTYPSQFGEKTLAPSWKSDWLSVMGRCTRIVLGEKDDLLSRLFVDGFLAQLAQEKNARGVCIVVPDFDRLSATADGIFSGQLANRLFALSRQGYVVVVECANAIALPRVLSEAGTAILTVLSESDTGVQIKNRKNYRVKLRAPLSAFSGGERPA